MLDFLSLSISNFIPMFYEQRFFKKISNKTSLFWNCIMPCPFTCPKMFCAGLNILSQPKNLTAFSASSESFVLAQKPILMNANHIFVWHKLFVTATICE